nr:MAG TPA: hypothetical protein [Caudoviricetes sp.]
MSRCSSAPLKRKIFFYFSALLLTNHALRGNI